MLLFTIPHTIDYFTYCHSFTGKEWCKSQWLAQRGLERGISETWYSYFGARYYDSDLSGLFLSVDPMADKYPSISTLIATHKSALRFRDTQSLPECPQDILLLELVPYCAWNPVKLVDPDGTDAEVVVDTDKKSITINTRIVLYAASKRISGKDVSRAQTMYKNKIMNSWGKNKDGKAWTVQYNGETYTVNFNVEVTVDNQAFFNNKREYDGKTNPGWECNIMTNSAKPVEQRNIDAIFIRNGRNLLQESINNNGNSIGLFRSCSRTHVYRFSLTSENKEL